MQEDALFKEVLRVLPERGEVRGILSVRGLFEYSIS